MAVVVVRSDAEEQRGLMRKRLMIVGMGRGPGEWMRKTRECDMPQSDSQTRRESDPLSVLA